VPSEKFMNKPSRAKRNRPRLTKKAHLARHRVLMMERQEFLNRSKLDSTCAGTTPRAK